MVPAEVLGKGVSSSMASLGRTSCLPWKGPAPEGNADQEHNDAHDKQEATYPINLLELVPRRLALFMDVLVDGVVKEEDQRQ